ncbi:MAG TPA: folylpolyglutamate synthase/dihydrofolate synthase family protein [Candidatus Methylacidiphilales bacterium]|jgi:dihydrofolate synthase/folylpolyglutamate synthase|nr:folylpolyglutamate synthase/dihydrofolate synthase family protein [Candidatus Methylacidiphilales bacterium]
MTYPDALAYLGQTRRFGMKLGLDSMRELARALGSPQDGLRFVHIAGTNGKGSTAAFCESCLRAAGFRVGLYTSPHLVSVRERIQINREMISEADFGEGMGNVRDMAERGNLEPTFFELMTALALWYLAREKVDWVVWETGLGGRLDATNIVTPRICIITNIGLDHQQYLGPTLAEIAAEKAGILKPGVPIVTSVEEGEAASVVRERATALGAPLFRASGDFQADDLGLSHGQQLGFIGHHRFRLGLVGPHQVLNAACAVVAMREIGLEENSIASGLEGAAWPGRFEILSERPLVVIDGAHNPAGMAMLVETWRSFLAARFGWKPEEIAGRARILFGSVADKDISEMAQLLRPLAKEVALVRLANERSADPRQLAPAFAALPVTCYESVADAWQSVQESDPSSVTLITGSLFLVGEMLARRQGIGEEYRLNERLEKPAESR